ncbi:MAG: putative DNA binding domain-containing protein [Candidatus Magasanikbacteria bacterium]|nr:putative DNA binding domain-containing protein [Candidatus Magasanikbacteria bacterium]
MTDQQIIEKIKYGLALATELPDLEFKTARNNVPNDIWRTISAFANRRSGGLMVFGVNQERNAVEGCENLDLMQRKLGEYFNDKMSFILRPEYHVIDYDGIAILAVYVPECPKDHMPCYYKPVGLPNGAYIREGNSNRRITDSEFRTYVATSKEFQFDLSEAVNVSRADLSEPKILHLLTKRETDVKRGADSRIDDNLLQNLGVVANFGGEFKPTVGGYLVFAHDPPQDRTPYERYLVRCVRYAGNNAASEIIDSADVKGTLDVQIDDSYRFVLKNIRKTAEIVGTKRVEKFEYPEAAIRELIANSVIHRDYKIIETYAQVKVFNDRIEILNPGSLPPGVTVENIKDAQFSRNSMIAGRLKDLDYLEEYGRGIDIVLKKMEEWGLPSPLFRNLVNSFEVILLGIKYQSLNERQMKIIDTLLIKGKLTAQDCEKILRRVPRATINYDLRELKDMGVIESHGASVNIFYTLAF